MKRKIIQLGSATLVTSLPSKWVKRYDLKPGDEIDIEEEDTRLIIRTKNDFGVDKQVLDVSDLHPVATYSLLAMYIRGVDELEVKSSDPKMLELLHRRPMPELLGYEIVDQGKNYMHIKDLTGIKEFDFNTMARRIFLLLKQMADDIIDVIEKGETDIPNMWSLDHSVNKFSWLCMRIINKRGIDPKKNAIIFNILTNIEEVGDYLNEFSKLVTTKNIKFSKDSVAFMKEVRNLLDAYYNLFFRFSQKDAAKFDKMYRDLASTPGGRLDKTHKLPDSKFDKLIERLGSIQEARALFIFKQIADLLGETARIQLIMDL
ncbi:phosphate uptake regulator PhoU [Candidatus Woesearchaeota archaeon]|nr:phosphate uptake regulator PhoU [Candidatus Woesearchaeota archaeon]